MNTLFRVSLLLIPFIYGISVMAQTLEKEAGVSSDTSAWDWSAFEAMDDTPTTAKGVQERAIDESQPRLTAQESAQPDMEAAPRTAYSLFSDMPEFEVIPSRQDSQMYPCKNCHEFAITNTEARALQKPHNNFQLKHGLHGKGEFWCFTCHDLKDKGTLKTLKGEYVDFDQAYIICSQCHVNQARDWAYGAHGKRVGNWQGERKIYNCTACHYQHDPSFKPRDALEGPRVRMGKQRPQHWAAGATRKALAHKDHKPWQSNDKASGDLHE